MLRRALFALLLTMMAAPAPLLGSEIVFHRGNGAEPETLDPHKAMGVPASNVLRDLYEGLVSRAPDGSLVPGVAERWEVSDDGLIYTFYLRRNARWSNGDALVAEDFVAGLRRCVDPATGSYYAQMLNVIENGDAVTRGELPPERLGVTALDDHTLRIRLSGPAPYLIDLLTHSTTYPIHRPSLAAHGDRFARAGNKVSNGAYQLQQWVVQSHVALVRNPHFWDNEQTQIDRVVYLPTEDLNAELKRYRAGELDWTNDVPITQMRWIRNNIPEQFHANLYLGSYYFGLNTTRPPFKDNVGLRHALSMVIDREIITERVVGTGEVPAYGWIPPGTHNYQTQEPEWASWPMQRRIEEARRLYHEAGYSDDKPLELELRYNTHENHRKVSIAIAYMWRQALGVRVRLINEEFKVFLTTRRLKQYTQAFRAGWIGDYNDAYTFAEILHSRHGLNDSGYDSAEYDALLAKAAAEADVMRRREYLEAAERVMIADHPIIPLYFYTTKRLVRPHVTGWQGNIMDHHLTRHMRIER
jgi:oligopeptide transport system substrate-binding protein